jgi:hypothetical protein
VSAQPNETPQESIRTALQLLRSCPQKPTYVAAWWYEPDDIRAIEARLEDAVAKLEAR